MLQFISFGSGSSGNCYLLRDDEQAIVVDSGIEYRQIRQYLDSYGINADGIHDILITHDHIDHTRSVGRLSNEWHATVHATRQTHHAIESNTRLTHKIATANISHITHGKAFRIGSFHITPFPVPHDSHTNTGYRIEHPQGVFAIATDIGHVTTTVTDYLKGAQHIVAEANYDPHMLIAGRYPYFLKRRIAGPEGHLSNAECAQMIAQVNTENLQNVWLCHLSEENNTPDIATHTVRQYLKQKNIAVDTQFTLTALNREKPTGLFTL